MTTTTPAEWNERYRTGDLPWDSGIRSRELARVLKEDGIELGRAVELGCGTGTNAVFLAEQGFDVTGIDLSPIALEQARRKAEAAGVAVEFLAADLCHFEQNLGPFDFVFDRGCYHCARRIGLPGFLDTLERLTRPGTISLVLAGNANEQTETEGPPRVHEHEIRTELGGLFDVRRVRPFRFEDADGTDGPLGWSCLLVRR
ncbi:MAG: class I SAM-dependent methyltransferase [Planctomycetaceae bacterium]